MNVLSIADHSLIKAHLLDHRKKLEAEIQELKKKASEYTAINRGSGDALENAAARVDTGVSLQMLAAKARAIKRIDDALGRINRNAYGACSCGEAISLERLKALPFVETCLGCQEEAERTNGRVRRGYAT